MATTEEQSPPGAGAFGTHIRQHREAADLSLRDLHVELQSRLPRSRWVSYEKLRRYENGMMPETRADPLLVIALADVFGCKVAELSPIADQAVQVMRDLLIRSCCLQYHLFHTLPATA